MLLSGCIYAGRSRSLSEGAAVRKQILNNLGIEGQRSEKQETKARFVRVKTDVKMSFCVAFHSSACGAPAFWFCNHGDVLFLYLVSLSGLYSWDWSLKKVEWRQKRQAARVCLITVASLFFIRLADVHHWSCCTTRGAVMSSCQQWVTSIRSDDALQGVKWMERGGGCLFNWSPPPKIKRFKNESPSFVRHSQQRK